MTRRIPFPVGNFSGIYDRMLTYDEHSGAGNNGWIQLNSREPLEEQNRQYVRFMNEATGEIDFMLRQGLSVIAQPSRYDAQARVRDAALWNALVYNGLSWTRSDVVRLDAPAADLKIGGDHRSGRESKDRVRHRRRRPGCFHRGGRSGARL